MRRACAVSRLCPGLRLGDIDMQRGLLMALGKGGKRRLVPVGEVAMDMLGRYLRDVRPRFAARGGNALFASPRGGFFSREGFWRIVRRYAVSAGIVPPSPRRTSCALRSFATHLLRGGAEPTRRPGHARPRRPSGTTEIYTHVAQDHVRQAHAKGSHPRAWKAPCSASL